MINSSCHRKQIIEKLDSSSRSPDDWMQFLMGEDVLFAVFQPIVDLHQGTVLGHEALIRGPVDTPWHPPLAMLALAATVSRSVDFELHCVATVLSCWVKAGGRGCLFLNLSAGALVEAVAGNAPRWLESTVVRSQVNASSIVVELTEQEKTNDLAMLRDAVGKVRELGMSIALDDFGEGHSNFRLWAELKPEFVKTDKFFTQDISSNPQKVEFLRALATLGQTLGTRLIAEGIEEAEDLRVLRDLGIRHGQGYLLGRPSMELAASVAPSASWSLVDHAVAVRPHSRAQAGRGVLRNLILTKAPTIDPRTLNDDVSRLFQAHPTLHALPVLRNEQPVALINRQSFMDDYARLYFREVHGRRACLGYANQSPRVVELDDNVEGILEILKSDDQRYLKDGFIVLDQGRYVGLGTGEQLVRTVTEARIEAARHANPLTFLPGNVPISLHIDRLLTGGGSFVVCYADLNNFKVFNDHYGYWRGDEMIRLFARTALDQVDPYHDFVGHIGGDDFMLLFQSSDWQRRCTCMMQTFAAEALTLYDDDAKEAGGIEGADRHGVVRFFPCTTVAIGAVCIRPGLYRRAEDVANEATAAKHDAKSAIDGFAIRHAVGLIEQ